MTCVKHPIILFVNFVTRKANKPLIPTLMKKTLFLSVALLMAAITGMAQPKCGLYKQTKFQTPEGQMEECTKDMYLMVNDGKTYEIQTYVVEGVRRVYVVEKDMKTLETVGEELHYTWTYDPSGYPGGQNTVKVTNVYLPAKKIISKDMSDFLALMDKVDKKGVKKNKLLGVWHEADESSSLYYKCYDKDVRMTVRIAKVNNNSSIIFTMEDVEYTKDGNTTEGGNPCTITWQGNNIHTLSYVYNGYTNTEKWSRTTLPAHVVSIFK